MKKLILLIPIILALAFILSCDKIGGSKNDNCQKDSETIKLYFDSPWSNSTFNVQEDDSNRIFQVYTDPFENVCPDEHIQVRISGQRISYIPVDRTINLQVDYRYGYFGVYGNTYVTDSYSHPGSDGSTLWYNGLTTFGIKDAYQDEPGSFYLNIEWHMTKGSSETADLLYFKQLTIYCWVEVTLKYYQN